MPDGYGLVFIVMSAVPVKSLKSGINLDIDIKLSPSAMSMSPDSIWFVIAEPSSSVPVSCKNTNVLPAFSPVIVDIVAVVSVDKNCVAYGTG